MNDTFHPKPRRVIDGQSEHQVCGVINVAVEDPRSYFQNLRAHGQITDLFAHLRSNETNHGILINSTGSGKTRGIAVKAILENLKVFFVFPKTVQVQMFVDFLSRNFPAVRIGFAADREVQYDLRSNYDIVVVTYGHLLRKVVGMLARGRAWFSDYIFIFDEVHESMEDIQAVLRVSPLIPNQRIITSATPNLMMIEDIVFQCKFKIFGPEIETVRDITFEYSPVLDAGNRHELARQVCSLVKENIGCDGRILIFVLGQSHIDLIMDMLIKDKVVAETDIALAHAELWDDEILVAVCNVKVIVGTNSRICDAAEPGQLQFFRLTESDR